VEDASVNALQAPETLKENSESIKPWLHRIAVNAALMKFLKNNRLAGC